MADQEGYSSEGCGRCSDIDKLEAEIERLRAIETAARSVVLVVRATHDHTKWFESLGALMDLVSADQQLNGDSAK